MTQDNHQAPAEPPMTVTSPPQREPTTVTGDGKEALAAVQMVELPPAAPNALVDIPPSLKERFDDLQFLGRGGMGTVYRGWDKHLAREVALKFVHGHDAARFLREARAQARVNHDNVCKIYDVGFADGQAFITMQLVRGESLAIASKDMTLEEKIKIIREAASALHEAHRLGLVHRDIKPSNILVERNENGLCRPFVMDFGLARIVGEQGQTITGQVAGTPAYMAPEQARGEVRLLDRRTDVYSLGATFYDILAGRPPFVDDQPWKVLMRIDTQDAPALRTVCRGIPRDLETIVMKCIERDPARRYDSARALGEDLQRYLDGELVLARQPSMGYRLVKYVRKHKVAFGLAGALAIVAAAVAVFTVRARFVAQREAQLARELGENVKEMELFLRQAYTLPLHDVEKEREIIRQQLASLETKIANADSVSWGAGQYAMARGHLALKDHRRALTYLQRAEASGYSSAEFEVAYGRVLVELYRENLEPVLRMNDPDKRAQLQAQLDATYKSPSLVHLRAALGARSEHPAYAEGLIAFVEKRYDDALTKAKEAFVAAPWLYEAKKLEGDIQYALGRQYGHDAQYDREKMRTYYAAADEAYMAAIEVGRSDPDVYRSMCEMGTKWVVAELRDARREKFLKYRSFCDWAVAASSRDAQARATAAFFYTFSGQTEGGTVDPHAKAEALLDEALELEPKNAFAHYVRGGIWHRKTKIFHADGNTDGYAKAIASFEQAAALDPSFAWPWNDMGLTFTNIVLTAVQKGQLDREALEKSYRAFTKATEVDPAYALAWANQYRLHGTNAWWLLEHGKSPTEPCARGLEALEHAQALGFNAGLMSAKKTYFFMLEARYAFDSGGDPRPMLDRALENAEKMRKEFPEAIGDVDLESIYLTRIKASIRDGQDPSADFANVRQVRDQSMARMKSSPNTDMMSAQIALAELYWAEKMGRVRPAMFDEILGNLQRALDKKFELTNNYVMQGETHVLRAAWLQKNKKDATTALVDAAAILDKALEKNPTSPRALALRGRLHLLNAQQSSDTETRRKAAQQAKESFDKAFSENPLLQKEWEFGPYAKEVEKLL